MPVPNFTEAARSFDLGRFDEAAQIAEQAVKLEPNDAYCYFVLALCEARLKRKKKALEFLKTANNLNPLPQDAHFHTSQVYGFLGDLLLAEKEILAALSISPNHPGYHVHYATLLKAKRWHEPALRELDIALSLSPSLSSALRLKASIFVLLGRRQEAEQISRGLLQSSPDSSSPHTMAGDVAMSEGWVDDALESYKEALRINPTSEAAKDGLLDALRSRFFIYRWYYACSLRLQALPAGVLWISIIVLGRGMRLVLDLHPPVVVLVAIAALMAILFVLALFRLFSKQAADALLLFNPLGRMLLDSHVKVETSWFLGSLFLFLVSVIRLNMTHEALWWAIILTSGISCLFMSLLGLASEKGLTRWAMFGIFAAVGLSFVGVYIRPLI